MIDRKIKDGFEKGILEGVTRDSRRYNAVNIIYQFNIVGDNGGSWTVDLSTKPPTVKGGASDNAQCIVTITEQVWLDLLAGKLNYQELPISGDLKIDNVLVLSIAIER